MAAGTEDPGPKAPYILGPKAPYILGPEAPNHRGVFRIEIMAMNLGRRGLQRGATAAGDDLRVPVIRVLGDAPARRVVHVDQPEALLVAVCPLEVVERGPVEIPLDRNPLPDRPVQLAQMPRQKVHALRIMHPLVERRPVAQREA